MLFIFDIYLLQSINTLTLTNYNGHCILNTNVTYISIRIYFSQYIYKLFLKYYFGYTTIDSGI